jgi:hypothetical protein
MASTALANDDDDIFSRGLGSLVALELAKSIKIGLSTYFYDNKLSFITTLMIFRNLTVKSLSQAISLGVSGELEQDSQTHKKDIERMIETYTSVADSQ